MQMEENKIPLKFGIERKQRKINAPNVKINTLRNEMISPEPSIWLESFSTISHSAHAAELLQSFLELQSPNSVFAATTNNQFVFYLVFSITANNIFF